MNYLHSANYRIDYFDETNWVFLLSKPTSLVSDGLSYRMQISELPDASTKVTLQVATKLSGTYQDLATEIFQTNMQASIFADSILSEEVIQLDTT